MIEFLVPPHGGALQEVTSVGNESSKIEIQPFTIITLLDSKYQSC